MKNVLSPNTARSRLPTNPSRSIEYSLSTEFLSDLQLQNYYVPNEKKEKLSSLIYIKPPNLMRSMSCFFASRFSAELESIFKSLL